MAEDQDSTSSGFKVIDRRSFTSEGKRLSDEPQSPARKPEPEEKTRPAARPAPEGLKEFETLVSYLSTTAMFQLGLLPGPEGERVPPDIANARQTVDLLEALQTKTRGNLTESESRLLQDVLYELRMSCLEIEKQMAFRHK